MNGNVSDAQASGKPSRDRKYSGYRGGKRKPGEKPKDLKGTARKLFELLAPYKFPMAVVLFTGIAGSFLSITGPTLLGDIVDAIQQQVVSRLAGDEANRFGIFTIIVKLGAIYLTSSLMTFIQNYVMAGVTQKVVCKMREDLNGKFSRLPLKFFDSHSRGDLLSRVVNDIDNISNTLRENVIQIISSVVMVIGVFIMMMRISWEMTFITIAIFPPSLLLVRLITKRSRKYFREQWDRTGEINGHIEEMFTGHTVVKAFSHEEKAISEFVDINEQLTRSSRLAQFVSGLIGPVLSFISNIGYAIVCVVGAIFVTRGTITLGGIAAFFTYSKLFMQPIVDLGMITNRLQSSLASAERAFNVLAEEEEPEDTVEQVIEHSRGSIVFENVSFGYSEDKPLFENLNLEVKPGQLVAIVGHTGAGKTTMVNLLMRFYEPSSGRILVDGVDIKKLSRENLRKIFGMVLQDTWLFNGTIKENIAYGREGAGDAELYAAANAARVNHFISTLSNGYDTVLEEDGANISQGQKQLLTIARALLADPAILILDEATSSVDTRTEIQVQKAMKTLMAGRTNFVIAHRLSTIKEADTILVMDNGRIVEQGRHAELLEKGGYYADLYNSQFGIVS